MRRLTFHLFAAALVAASACASTGTSAGGDAQPSRRSSSASTLTSAEFTAAAQQNMRDVIVALRPRWLQNTSAGSISTLAANRGVMIYVNGRPSGGLEALAGIDKSAVDRVVYSTASEADSRYGTANGATVIDVRLKVGGR